MDTRYEIVKYMESLPIRASFSSVDSIRMHWHPEMEILFVLKGSIHVLVQSETFLLHAGEVAVISSNVIHATRQTEEGNRILMVQINCEKFSYGEQPLETVLFHCIGSVEQHPEIGRIRRCLCEILLETTQCRPGYQHAVTAQIHTILGILFRSFPHAMRQSLDAMKPKDRERMQRIIEYIDERYTARVSLTEIADREYLSVNHMSAFFKRMIGMNFGEYVNAVRMKAYVERLQSDPCTPVDALAMQCGFSSSQYATALFAKQYRTTPGKFRKQLQQRSAVRNNARDFSADDPFAAVYEPEDIAELMRYLKREKDHAAQQEARIAREDIQCDARRPTGRYHRSCVRIAAIGRAYEGLLTHTQEALRRAQREIGFTHLRFHGIFNDDMMIVGADSAGVLRYSWRSPDMLIDFMLSIGLRPFFELTYMPRLLASGPESVFAWRGNITPPAELAAWRRLVFSFVAHCVDRYGRDEVGRWLFEAWSEPDMPGVGWTGTEQSFYAFYAETALAVKEACPEAKVCGPSVGAIGIAQRAWTSGFMEYCRQHHVPVDLFSFHAYPELLDAADLPEEMQRANMLRMAPQDGRDMLRGPDYVCEQIGEIRRQLGDMGMPLVGTQWNLTMIPFNPISDTPFAGTALIETAISCDAENVQLARWTLTDYIEEQRALPKQEFHGGFGMMTAAGVRKPTYWAMWALAQLGDAILTKGPHAIVTRKGSALQVLFYHHPKAARAYELAYARGIDVQPDPIDLALSIRGGSGRYRARRYLFDPALCDARTLWLALGLGDSDDTECFAYLSERAQPLRREESLQAGAGGALQLSSTLAPCGFELVTLAPE